MATKIESSEWLAAIINLPKKIGLLYRKAGNTRLGYQVAKQVPTVLLFLSSAQYHNQMKTLSNNAVSH